MKVIDKQLLFINSDERDSGSPSDFVLSMPSHLLTCRQHQNMRMVLNDVVMPYTWYNVQETNRHFEVVENGAATKVSLSAGSYHAIQLRDHLNGKLGAHATISVTFSETSSLFTFTLANPLLPIESSGRCDGSDSRVDRCCDWWSLIVHDRRDLDPAGVLPRRSVRPATVRRCRRCRKSRDFSE